MHWLQLKWISSACARVPSATSSSTSVAIKWNWFRNWNSLAAFKIASLGLLDHWAPAVNGVRLGCTNFSQVGCGDGRADCSLFSAEQYVESECRNLRRRVLSFPLAAPIHCGERPRPTLRIQIKPTFPFSCSRIDRFHFPSSGGGSAIIFEHSANGSAQMISSLNRMKAIISLEHMRNLMQRNWFTFHAEKLSEQMNIKSVRIFKIRLPFCASAQMKMMKLVCVIEITGAE